MSSPDTNQLMNDAKCVVRCVPVGMHLPVLISLMNQILESGGTGGAAQGVFIGNYGGAAPTETPTATVAYAWDTSNWQEWAWYAGAWHQTAYYATSAFNTASVVTFNHGMGAVPRQVDIMLRCDVNDAGCGYLAGDYVDIGPLFSSGFIRPAWGVVRTTTQVLVLTEEAFGFNSGNMILPLRNGTGVGHPSTFADWTLVCYARL